MQKFFNLSSMKYITSLKIIAHTAVDYNMPSTLIEQSSNLSVIWLFYHTYNNKHYNDTPLAMYTVDLVHVATVHLLQELGGASLGGCSYQPVLA